MPDKSNRYRIVAVSLYSNEVIEADRITEVLRTGGWSTANRSLVVREALSHLFDDLVDKTPEDVFRYFLDRQSKRAMRGAKPM